MDWNEITVNPEKEGNYLVTFAIPKYSYDKSDLPNDLVVSVCRFDGEFWCGVDIIAWAKLPEPYTPPENIQKDLIKIFRKMDNERLRKIQEYMDEMGDEIFPF